MNMGTAGGYTAAGGLSIGDAVIGSGAVFAHRYRSSSQKSFNWGLYGGPVLRADKLVQAINQLEAANNNTEEQVRLRFGVISSQINYGISPLDDLVFEQLGVVSVDMETASEAQILSQLEMHFIPLRVISNGVYPMHSEKMEEEYVENKALVSKKGTDALVQILSFLAPNSDYGGTGVKKIADLSSQ
eukprot:TRINITY_DN8526_c0_g1_i2.p1 TRINITY_DN8526_c0_g1~~TRINITY_DN8526_c0_g1_i2.p1  ORF type:complete len:187 (+),score=36.65 TRINITY_DN8526_c0_g1_i2:900-1460(+)